MPRFLAAVSFLILASTLLVLPVVAGDPVYRWVDKDGVIHYGSKPPDKDAKPATLPNLQTYSPRLGNRPPVAVEPAASTKPGPSIIREVRVLSPVQDEIFRDPSTPISVSISVQPALPEGAGVIFYLNGAAKNARPIYGTSMSFGSVDRGEHTVTAAVVDASGKELMRAPPVTFHAKPPIAR